MKDSNSIFQITLFKTIIVIYFLYIILNSLGSSVSFFHDNAEFGIWAFISFIMISVFILIVDIAIIILITKAFKNKNKRVYILIFQTIICVIVYFGLNYMFKNADKWNEYTINDVQTLHSSNHNIHSINPLFNSIAPPFNSTIPRFKFIVPPFNSIQTPFKSILPKFNSTEPLFNSIELPFNSIDTFAFAGVIHPNNPNLQSALHCISHYYVLSL